MTFFVIILVIFLVIFIFCNIFTICAYKRSKKGKEKIVHFKNKIIKEKFLMFASIFASVLSFLAMLYTLFSSVPAPIIYPLDNDAKIYSGITKISMDTNPFFLTYYTLDGSDPKKGIIYEDTFAITETTTISAINKFRFGGWSDISQRTYRFENMQITYSSELDLLISDKLPSASELLDYTIYIIIFAIIIWTFIRKAWQNICDKIRDFFNP